MEGVYTEEGKVKKVKKGKDKVKISKEM